MKHEEKILTFQEFAARSFDKTGICNWKIILTCENCTEKEIHTRLKNFLTRRFWQLELCTKCYFRKFLYDNPEWIKKNSDAQKISQNKPEQILKNALAVSKSWDAERKKKCSDWMKNRWEIDEKYRTTALNNLSWTDGKDMEKFNKILSQTLHKGRFTGEHNGILYQSILEFSFLLFCEENKISVNRYDLPPIPYFFNETQKTYIPDSVINGNIIVEIKSKTFVAFKNQENLVAAKENSAQIFANRINFQYQIFYENDIPKTFYKKASNLHKLKKRLNETQK